MSVNAISAIIPSFDGASDPKTPTVEQLPNPDFHHKVWKRTLGESWGDNRLDVFRSSEEKMLMAYYRKEDIWVHICSYDEQLESTDDKYEKYVATILKRTATDYKCTQTSDQKTNRFQKCRRTNRKTKVSDDSKLSNKDSTQFDATVISNTPTASTTSTSTQGINFLEVLTGLHKTSQGDSAATASSSVTCAGDSVATSFAVPKAAVTPVATTDTFAIPSTATASNDASDTVLQVHDDERKNLEAEIAKLKEQNEKQTERAERAEHLHKQYLNREGKRNRETDNALQREKESYTRQKDALMAATNKQQGSLPCLAKYLDLLNKISLSYELAIQNATTTTGSCKYQFESDQGWEDISDKHFEDFLTKMSTAEASYNHSNGHTYQIFDLNLQANFALAQSYPNAMFLQRNKTYLKDRPIRLAPVKPTNGKKILSDDDRFNILFGAKSPIKFDYLLEETLESCNFAELPQHVISPDLTAVANIWGGLGSGFRYDALKTELWVKPEALKAFCQHAKAAGMNYGRLVMHGGTDECYNDVREQARGLSLKYAGTHGSLYGHGGYFALSDHATHYYNGKSSLPAGSGIIALMSSYETLEAADHYHSIHRHGGMTTYDTSEIVKKLKDHFASSSDTDLKEFSTFALSNPAKDKKHNCIVFHDEKLYLILGLVVSTGKKK